VIFDLVANTCSVPTCKMDNVIDLIESAYHVCTVSDDDDSPPSSEPVSDDDDSIPSSNTYNSGGSHLPIYNSSDGRRMARRERR